MSLPSISMIAAGHVLQSRDQAQEGGLAAAGRPDEDDELPILDGQIQRRDDVDVAEGLGDACERDATHVGLLYLTAPKVSPRTSCFWLNQPMTRMGAMASIEAAESLA